jgi:hypothetical protein
MDDVTRGGFVLDTTAVIDAYHIATSHMAEHGWVETDMEADPDGHISKDGGSNDKGEEHSDYSNPMAVEIE